MDDSRVVPYCDLNVVLCELVKRSLLHRARLAMEEGTATSGA
jgi:hypothetical protein